MSTLIFIYVTATHKVKAVQLNEINPHLLTNQIQEFDILWYNTFM